MTLPAVGTAAGHDGNACPEPTTHRSLPPSRHPTVETVRFSATGDDLIHDGIFLQAKERGGDHYDVAYAACRATTTSLT